MISYKDYQYSFLLQLENVWFPKLRNKTYSLDDIIKVNPFTKSSHLDIPKNKKRIYCYNCNIKSITIPEGVERLMCSGNSISKIKIPSSLEVIVCNITDELEQQDRSDMYMVIHQKR